MRILLAYFLRYCHSLIHIFEPAKHYPVAGFAREFIFGYFVPTKITRIGCSCGKVWYNTLRD